MGVQRDIGFEGNAIFNLDGGGGKQERVEAASKGAMEKCWEKK